MSDFLDLFKGKEFAFYGVCGLCFKLDDKVFEAKADNDDGYRSYLDSVVLVDSSNLTFFSDPICTVCIKPSDLGQNSFMLEDALTGQAILKVGTEHEDDYYPVFSFIYTAPQVLGKYYEFKYSKLFSLASLIKD